MTDAMHVGMVLLGLGGLLGVAVGAVSLFVLRVEYARELRRLDRLEEAVFPAPKGQDD